MAMKPCQILILLMTVSIDALPRNVVSGFTVSQSGAPKSLKPRCSQLSMATAGPLNCRMIGIGSSTPSKVITNVDLESFMETSDEWISTRTGISERRVIQHHNGQPNCETISSLSSSAAKKALEMSGLDPLDIDLIIMCSSSPDDMFGDATTVQKTLGCTNAVAFDLTAACSGFLFGSITAGQFMHNGHIKNTLVVGGDALSRWVDWDDRNSCILFGDGAGAAVYTKCNHGDKVGILGFSMHSNGRGHEDLMLR